MKEAYDTAHAGHPVNQGRPAERARFAEVVHDYSGASPGGFP